MPPLLMASRNQPKNGNYLISVVLAKEEHVDFAYYEHILRDIRVAGIIALSAFPSLEVARHVNA